MTLTRAKIIASIESVEAKQRQFRAMVRASYSTGTLTPDTRVRARRTFGVLRVKRSRLVDWLGNHPHLPTGSEGSVPPGRSMAHAQTE